ncbi:MAG: 30S ribosome-binding factor RbfA [Bacteroidales bacterium]|nr:30S ribosome-binding factor RbfA [Bacteroidales bacterium]
METKRQSQMARLIQKELADIFIKESKNWVRGVMLTITTVRMTADLSIARVYVSVFPSADADLIIKDINKHSGLIRKLLGNAIKNQVRHIPELNFFLDDSHDIMEKIDKALKS